MRVRPLHVLSAALLAVSLLLSGCSSLEGTGDKGYVTAGGQITELNPGDRKDPIDLSGKDLDGKQVSVEDHRGKVVVIPIWGYWCTECHEEAPLLTEVANESDQSQVAFLGINNRDATADTAKAFVRQYDVPYPSIFDPSARALLAFDGSLTPYSTPSTVILDRQGRVAAIVLGVIPSKTTLTSLIKKVSKEKGTDADG
ncbi:MAG: TlpA family protein disulfide reductase [Nocardioides sp.]|nr:TlpA family protein disulfide reductase [Nocardioides sp.]